MPNKFVDTYNHLFERKGFDYDAITDGVFIGTNMCCQFGFDKELLQKGVRADISLEEERVDAPVGVDYFLWLPTKDGQAPARDKLLLGVQTLEFLIDRKIKVYIHCKNGHGRAPTLFAAYFIKRGRGMGIDEAISFMKNKRPAVHLNETQIEVLRKFKAEIIKANRSRGNNLA